MAPKALSKRMTLHCLFAIFQYDRTNDEWWRIFASMHDTSPERQKDCEDHSQRDSDPRSLIYRKPIMKPTNQHTEEEFRTWSQVLAAIIRHARLLGVVLPGG